MNRAGLFLSACFFVGLQASASVSQVTLSATHNLAYVGDRIGVTLLVKADASLELLSAVLSKDSQKYELISEGRLEKRVVAEGVVWEQKYEVAFFDLGDFTIGPAQVRVCEADNETTELVSNDVPIRIKALLKGDNPELEPGKPPLVMTGSPLHLLRRLWLPLLILCALAALIVVLTRKKRPLVEKAVPLSPVSRLERGLKKLMQEKLFEKGFQVMFFLRLTHLVRVFIKGFHGLDAEEMTSEELRNRLQGRLPHPAAEEALYALLKGADLVKFARHEMPVWEYELILDRLGLFVAHHRQEEQKRALADDQKGGACV
jgi:hypothetical protein